MGNVTRWMMMIIKKSETCGKEKKSEIFFHMLNLKCQKLKYYDILLKVGDHTYVNDLEFDRSEFEYSQFLMFRHSMKFDGLPQLSLLVWSNGWGQIHKRVSSRSIWRKITFNFFLSYRYMEKFNKVVRFNILWCLWNLRF